MHTSVITTQHDSSFHVEDELSAHGIAHALRAAGNIVLKSANADEWIVINPSNLAVLKIHP